MFDPGAKKPQIAFFGTPDFAVWVLERLKERGIVPDLVVSAPDAPKGRKLVLTPPPAKALAMPPGPMIPQCTFAWSAIYRLLTMPPLWQGRTETGSPGLACRGMLG